MGNKLTPEQKVQAKLEKAQERKALISFYELIRKSHSKGALVDVELPKGVSLEEILAGKNPK